MVRVRVDNDRAIAASLVSPVSTGPLLSSPVACLASPISANPWWTPTQGPNHTGAMLKLVRWLRTVRKFLRVRSSKRMIIVSQASPAKGVACKISERLESQNQCCMTQWAERVDIHTCETLSSGLPEALYWP